MAEPETSSVYLRWFVEVRPVLVVAVTALAGYCAVDRGAQHLREREHDLNVARSNHAIRTEYLGKAAESEGEVRLRYLRYLAQAETDPVFRDWATIELDLVGKEIVKLEQERDEAIKKLTYAEAQLAKARVAVSEADQRRKAAEEHLEKVRNSQAGSAAETEAAAAAAREAAEVEELRFQLKNAEVAAAVLQRRLQLEEPKNFRRDILSIPRSASAPPWSDTDPFRRLF